MNASPKAGKEAPLPRVATRHQSLHCRICGGTSPVTSEAAAHGWFACRYCGAASPVAGAGDLAVQGPRGEVTALIGPGSTTFLTTGDSVVRYTDWIWALIIGDVLVSGLSWLAHHVARGHDAGLSQGLFAVLASAAALGWIGCQTRQRIHVADDRVTINWLTFGLAWRFRTISTRGLRVHRLTETGRVVELRALKDAARARFENRETADWFAREVEQAVSDSTRYGSSELVSCPACGGPVALERALRNRRAMTCEHCQTGLLQTGGGIALPPVELEGVLDSAPPRDEPSRTDSEAIEWRLSPYCLREPALALPLLCLVIGLMLAGLSAAWYFALHTPILHLVAWALALAVTAGAGSIVWLAFGAFAGITRFRLGGGAFQHKLSLGPLLWRDDRVPLARLISLRVTQLPGGLVLSWRGATQGKVELPLGKSPEVRIVLAGILGALPRHLRAVGRISSL